MSESLGKLGFMLLAGLVLGLVIGYSVGARESADSPLSPPVADQSPVEEVSTPVTESPSAENAEPTVAVEEPQPDSVVARGDQRACEILLRASEREPNSPSWIDMMGDANSAAKDYDLMDLIDKAFWSSGDAKAASRVTEALALCRTLGAL